MGDNGSLLHCQILARPRKVAEELTDLLMGAQLAGDELSGAQWE